MKFKTQVTKSSLGGNSCKYVQETDSVLEQIEYCTVNSV